MRFPYPKVIGVAIGLGFAGLFPASVSGEEPVQVHEPQASFGEEHFQAAVARFGQKDWDGTIAEATRYIELAQREARDFRRDESAKRAAGDLEAADHEANQAFEDLACVAKAAAVRAKALFSRGQPGDAVRAVADFSLALGESAPSGSGNDLPRPSDAEPSGGALVMPQASIARLLEQRGWAKEGAGDEPGAREDFTRAINLVPDNVQFVYDRSRSLFVDGQFALAEADFAKAVALAPDIVNANVYAGLRAYLAGDFRPAERFLDHAIKLDPTQGYAHYLRAVVKTCDGSLAEAAADFDDSIKHAGPNDRWLAEAWLARHYLRQRLHQDDPGFTEHVAQLGPGFDRNLVTELARRGGGQPSSAVRADDPTMTANEHEESFYFVGLELLRNGDHAEARRAFDACRQCQPKFPFFRHLAEAELARLKPASK